MMYLAMSWTSDNWILIEGVFDKEAEARDVTRIQNRRISVMPIEPNIILPDADNWPGSYYVYPDGTIYKPEIIK